MLAVNVMSSDSWGIFYFLQIMLMMPLMVCWEYPWSEMGLDECLGGKFVDVISDLKNSDVIVEVGTIIVGVVDNPLGRNPTA